MTKKDFLFVLILLLVGGLTYLLGWSMRGDEIYGGMFDNTVQNVGTLLPVKNEKQTPK